MEDEMVVLKKKINDHARTYASQNDGDVRKINSKIKKNTGTARGDMTLDELETLAQKMDSWFPLTTGHGES